MPQDSGLTQILFLYLPIFGIFYFFVIRPQQKKQKELKAMIENIKKGDEVVTASGIHGTVTYIKDKTVVLKVDDNCDIEFDKEVIALVKSKTIKPEVIK